METLFGIFFRITIIVQLSTRTFSDSERWHMLTHVDLHACDYFDTQQLEKVDPRETNRLGWFVDVPNKSSVEFVYFPICFRFSEQNLHLKTRMSQPCETPRRESKVTPEAAPCSVCPKGGCETYHPKWLMMVLKGCLWFTWMVVNGEYDWIMLTSGFVLVISSKSGRCTEVR